MTKRRIARLATIVCLLLASFAEVKAQNTTSSVVGTTSDGEEILIGAVVRLTHVESGTTFSTVSNAKGM